MAKQKPLDVGLDPKALPKGTPPGPMDPRTPQEPDGKFATFMGQLGDLGTSLTKPNEATGMSALDSISTGAAMIDASRAKWDISGKTPTPWDILEEAKQRGKLNARQAKADTRDDWRFGQEQSDAAFQGEARTQQRTAWEREAQTYKDFDTWLASLPKEDQARMKLMGPTEAVRTFENNRNAFMAAGAGAIYNPTTGEFRVFDKDARDLERRQTESEIGYRRALGAAAGGGGRPEGASPHYAKPTARDMQMFSDFNTSAQAASAALPSIERLRQTVEALGSSEFGQPFEVRTRMKLSQLFHQNQKTLGLQQALQADSWNIVLQNIKGLAPVSEAELKLAMENTINGNWTHQQALSYLTNLERQTRQIADRGYDAMDWASTAGSYATGKDAEGRSWAENERRRYALISPERPNAPLPQIETSAVAALRLAPTPENKASFEREFHLQPGQADLYIRGRDTGKPRTR
jgi:hypothetical protein